MDTEKDESTKHAGGEASGSAAGSPAPKATEKEETRQDAGSTAPASQKAKRVRFEEPGRDSDGREQRKQASETPVEELRPSVEEAATSADAESWRLSSAMTLKG